MTVLGEATSDTIQNPDQRLKALEKGYMDKLLTGTGGMDYGLDVISTLIMIHRLAESLPPEQAKLVQTANFEAFGSLAGAIQSGKLKSRTRVTT